MEVKGEEISRALLKEEIPMYIWLDQVHRALEVGETGNLRGTLWEFERILEGNPKNELAAYGARQFKNLLDGPGGILSPEERITQAELVLGRIGIGE